VAVKIEFEKSTREALARALSQYLNDELGADIGVMDATRLLDFISESLGPHYYNQALHDARAHLHAKIDVLGDSFYELEKTSKL
jgi:uncharacterized protein (DUF2164 family)